MKKQRNISSCIESVPIFKNLNSSELDEIMDISHHQELDKGQNLYQAGDHLDSLYVVHQGKVKIARYSQDGKEQIIRILNPGEFMGELALFGEEKVTTFAEAIEPSVVCLVQNKRLKQLMTNSPDLTFKMMNELANRLEKAEAMIEQSNLYSASAKVAKLLLQLAKNSLVRFQTTKVNLASQLGISAETFSRKLKEFSEVGLIEVINHKTIKIHDPSSLEQMINPKHL